MDFSEILHLTYVVSLLIVCEISSGDTKKWKNNNCPSTDVSERYKESWSSFKFRYNKTYKGIEEISYFESYVINLQVIYEHNLYAAAGHHCYTLRDNHLSDLDTKQYRRKLLRLKPSPRRRIDDDQMLMAMHHDPKEIPEHVDWRDKGFTTAAVDQLKCGSCYAYSVAESVQGQILKRTGEMVALSAQQLVDCTTTEGNRGCLGGSLKNTLKYLAKTGIMPQVAYPYTAQKGNCMYQKALSVANITKWGILPAGDERALQIAVATIGPVPISINASPKTFQLYNDGVYDDENCKSDVVNHAMLVVGYTKDVWFLKNWWGDDWGEKGYMRLRRHKNRCGVANYALYVEL